MSHHNRHMAYTEKNEWMSEQRSYIMRQGVTRSYFDESFSATKFYMEKEK